MEGRHVYRGRVDRAATTWTNAAGLSFTYNVAPLMRNVGGTDLWTGTVQGPIDPSIHAVPIARPTQVGQPILSVGYYFRAGQNTIASTSPGFLSWNYSATTPLRDMLQAWDSGGPTFVEETNGLALAGIHDSIGANVSYDTDVTGLVSAIDAELAANGINELADVGVPPPTPGPSSLALVGIGLAAWLGVRQRGRQVPG